MDRERERKIVNYLRRHQLPDGGYSLYEQGPANLSATIKAYFAMKVAGTPTDDPAMVAARARIHALGRTSASGCLHQDPCSRCSASTTGRASRRCRVEIMLLPRWSYFNLLEVSYWSRTVIVPLLIVMDRKPVKRLPGHLRLDELWVVPREQASLRLDRVPRPFSPKTFLWKNFFIGVDDCLKGWERLGPRPFRARADGCRAPLARRAARGSRRVWAASSPP